MGGLIQQVNLYRPKPAASTAGRGVHLALVGVIVAVLAMLGLAGVGEYQLAGVQAKRDAVAGNLSRLQADVERLRDQLVVPAVDPFLESELAALRARQRHLNNSLLAIAQYSGDASDGFSEFFSGLARNPVDGLWFSNVGLAAGGREVVLRGKTTQPALVPRLLQTLSAEQAFVGRTFRNVNFQRRDDAGVVEFELRSAQTGEAADAG